MDSAKTYLMKNAMRMGKTAVRKYGPQVLEQAKAYLGEKLSSASTVTVAGKTAKLKYGAEISGGEKGDITTTKFKSKMRPSPISASIKKIMRNVEYVTRNSYQTSSPINLQAMSDFTSGASIALTTADMTILSGLYTGNQYSATSLTAGVINEGSIQAVNQLVTAQGAVYTNTAKILHKSCHVETQVANRSIYPISIDIYEVVARRDLAIYGGITNTSIVHELNDRQVYSPANFWIYGLTNTQAGAVDPKLSAYNIGSKPTDSDLFNLYWKIQQKFTVNLGAGDVHQHISDYSMNRILDGQQLAYSNILQGVTRNIMIVVKGSVSDDAGAGTGVTIGPARINVDHRVTYYAAGLPNTQTYTAYNEPYGTITSTEATVVDGPQTGVIPA